MQSAMVAAGASRPTTPRAGKRTASGMQNEDGMQDAGSGSPMAKRPPVVKPAESPPTGFLKVDDAENTFKFLYELNAKVLSLESWTTGVGETLGDHANRIDENHTRAATMRQCLNGYNTLRAELDMAKTAIEQNDANLKINVTVNDTALKDAIEANDVLLKTTIESVTKKIEEEFGKAQAFTRTMSVEGQTFASEAVKQLASALRLEFALMPKSSSAGAAGAGVAGDDPRVGPLARAFLELQTKFGTHDMHPAQLKDLDSRATAMQSSINAIESRASHQGVSGQEASQSAEDGRRAETHQKTADADKGKDSWTQKENDPWGRSTFGASRGAEGADRHDIHSQGERHGDGGGRAQEGHGKAPYLDMKLAKDTFGYNNKSPDVWIKDVTNYMVG